MICKSNNNSYHDCTRAFFRCFFSEKVPHPNAVEKMRIRGSFCFIIFHVVLNCICCGDPRSAFVISASRFSQKPIQDMQQINIICHLYIAQNIDTVLSISSQMLNIYIVLWILFCTNI